MQIHGPAHVHGPQPMSGPHRHQPTNPAQPASGVDHTDQLDISPEAQHVSRVRELAEIRADRVSAIRQQIADGTYDTDEKMSIALDRLLDEIGG